MASIYKAAELGLEQVREPELVLVLVTASVLGLELAEEGVAATVLVQILEAG